MKKSLDDLRVEIDKIDDELATIFEKRMNVVKDISLVKKENNLPVLDSSREDDILEKNVIKVKDELQPYYLTFLKEMLEISKSYQRNILKKNLVGYQGTEGAFSYLATQEIYPTENKISFPTFEKAISAVENDEINSAVLPFENSYTGEVGEILDLLLKHDVYINKIIDVKIEQNLVGIKGSNLQNIERIYSHEQALTQCASFLQTLNNVQLIPYSNTALAAKHVISLNNPKCAAITSKETAKLFNLEILKENINDDHNVSTKFITISKNIAKVGNRFNLLFSVKEGKGQLLEIIKIFSNHDFNLESIKSRTMKNSPWKYYFYIEVDGDINSNKTKDLLKELNESCEFVKILGNYTV